MNVQNESLQNRPEFVEPLVKADAPQLGEWAGLPIVAIGPKGGKIVGYNAGGKPIYAGSKQAEKLAQAKTQSNVEAFATAGAVKEWLTETIGVPAIVDPSGKKIVLSNESAKLVSEHFVVTPKAFVSEGGVKSAKLSTLTVKDLIPHLGKALAPKTPEEAATFAAKAGAGELDKDPFPPLKDLKREEGTKQANIAEGSHGNWLFRAPDGRAFVFKKGDLVICRAEEAADRISRLILGQGKAPAVKHVELDGVSGVLLEWLDGEVLNQTGHSDPPTKALQDNFDEVVAHHMVDWLVSNHDGHAGNFLLNKDGMVAFDKGQAWKWYGEDKLDPNYKGTNHSWPIYHKFWLEFAAGNIEGDPIEAARKALEKVEQITPEQYKQIVMPYAVAAAKKGGGDAEQIAEQLTSRLKTLRTDWEKFLSKVLGKKVTLEDKSTDNFGTMPESGLTEPGATVAMEKPPTAPIQKEAVTGWPQTKGPVTVFNPGTPPPPGAKWPKGYPGDGFQAQVMYKGELFTVEFMLHGGKEFGAFVHFPDGTTKEFPSPNAASDALVLYQKKLDLNLNATEKKKLGISYPAGKAFGIQKFQKEIEAAHSANEEDLKEKFEEAPTDWEPLPKQSETAWYAFADTAMVGTTLRVKREKGPVVIVHKTGPGKWVWQAPSLPVDEVSNDALAENLAEPQIVSVELAPVGEKPKEPAPKVDTKAAKVEVPPSAPSTYSGPLPPGCVKEVTKKFAVEGGKPAKFTVLLEVTDAGKFKVSIPSLGADLGAFDSLSSASDAVWVKQKGYNDAADYKAQNNTNKIPSGGGWKFWGIDPKAVTPATEVPVTVTAEAKVKEPAPTTDVQMLEALSSLKTPAEPLTTHEQLKTAPVGSVLSFVQKLPGKETAYQVTKQEGADNWQYNNGEVVGYYDLWGQTQETKGIESPILQKPKGYSFPIEDPAPGWARMPPTMQTLSNIKDFPVGSKVRVWDIDTDNWLELTKAADGWDAPLAAGGEGISAESVFAWVKESSKPPQYAVKGGATESGVEDWKPLDINAEPLVDFPPGTKIRAMLGGEPVLWEKINSTNWAWDSGTISYSIEVRKTLEDEGDFIAVALPPKVVEISFTNKIAMADWTEANLKAAPVGYSVTFWNTVIDKQVTYTKEADGHWHGETVVDNELLANKEWVKGPMGSAPLAPAPVAKEKAPMASKIGAAMIHLQPLSHVPSAAAANLETVFNAAPEWSEQPDPDLPPVGAKSPLWPGWVPPPGVVIEGEHEGKKYWLVNVVQGFSKEGEPYKGVRFSIIDEDGNWHHGATSNSAAKALKSAVHMAEWYPLVNDKKLNANVLKKSFGLTGTVFAAGETFGTLKSGSGPSAVPSAATVVDKHPSDMTPAEKKQPVKVSMTLAQAFMATFPNALITDGIGSEMFVVPTPESGDADKTLEDLKAFMKALELPNTGDFHVSHAGAYVTIPKLMVDHEVVATITADKAASYPTPSLENWETMPDFVPKVLLGTEDYSATMAIVEACPPGTKLVRPNGGVWEKTKEDNWKAGEDEVRDEDIAVQFSGTKCSIVPPFGDVPMAKPQPKKKPKAKPLPEKTPEQLAAEKKAKEIATWAKTNGPVNDDDSLHVLAYFQALAPKTKIWARRAPDGDLIIGAENEKKLAYLRKKLSGKVGEPFESPVDGAWIKVSLEDLKTAIPGNAAGTIVGPDALNYPAGTTFDVKTEKTLVSQVLDAEVTKLRDHKSNPNLKVAKLLGTEDEQAAKLKELAKKIGIDEPEIAVGGNYTMLMVPTSMLSDVVSTKDVVIPTSPPQPKPFVSASLPTFGGNVKDGEAVGINRGDLAIMESIITPQSGHYVRCGKHGTFWNDQVKVTRVRDVDGKVYYEVMGQLRDTSKLEDMTFEPFVFSATDGTKFDHYDYNQITYEPDTGTLVRNGGVVASMSGRAATTSTGTRVQVLDDEGKEALHGVFKIRVPIEKDLEQEMAAGFASMGISSAEAMAEPTEEDDRLFRKYQLLRGVGGTEFWRWSQSMIRDEDALDKALASCGVTDEIFQNTKVVAGFNGKQVVTTDHDKDAIVDAGVEFVYMGMGGISSVYARLREGKGLWANRAKWLCGVKGSEGSVNSDHNGGGTCVAFTRLGNVNADGDSWGYKCEDVKFIIHPRVLERTDWFDLNGDHYGKWANHNSGKRGQQIQHHESSNECDFEDGISLRDVAGVVVETAAEKQQLIGWLKKDGIVEVNGIALEHFIQVATGRSRSNIANIIPGLKKGVLP